MCDSTNHKAQERPKSAAYAALFNEMSKYCKETAVFGHPLFSVMLLPNALLLFTKVNVVETFILQATI